MSPMSWLFLLCQRARFHRNEMLVCRHWRNHITSHSGRSSSDDDSIRSHRKALQMLQWSLLVRETLRWTKKWRTPQKFAVHVLGVSSSSNGSFSSLVTLRHQETVQTHLAVYVSWHCHPIFFGHRYTVMLDNTKSVVGETLVTRSHQSLERCMPFPRQGCISRSVHSNTTFDDCMVMVVMTMKTTQSKMTSNNDDDDNVLLENCAALMEWSNWGMEHATFERKEKKRKSSSSTSSSSSSWSMLHVLTSIAEGPRQKMGWVEKALTQRCDQLVMASHKAIPTPWY